MSSRIDKGVKFKPHVKARRAAPASGAAGPAGARPNNAAGPPHSSQSTVTQAQTQQASLFDSSPSQHTAISSLGSDTEEDADDRRSTFSNEPPRLVAALPRKSPSLVASSPAFPAAAGRAGGVITPFGTASSSSSSSGGGGGGGSSMMRPFQSSATAARAVNRPGANRPAGQQPSATLLQVKAAAAAVAAASSSSSAGSARARAASLTPSASSKGQRAPSVPRAPSVARSSTAMSPPSVPTRLPAPSPIPNTTPTRRGGNVPHASSLAKGQVPRNPSNSPRIMPQQPTQTVASQAIPRPFASGADLAGPPIVRRSASSQPAVQLTTTPTETATSRAACGAPESSPFRGATSATLAAQPSNCPAHEAVDSNLHVTRATPTTNPAATVPAPSTEQQVTVPAPPSADPDTMPVQRAESFSSNPAPSSNAPATVLASAPGVPPSVAGKKRGRPSKSSALSAGTQARAAEADSRAGSGSENTERPAPAKRLRGRPLQSASTATAAASALESASTAAASASVPPVLTATAIAATDHIPAAPESSSGPRASTVDSDDAPPPKRGRGRPRKTSADASATTPKKKAVGSAKKKPAEPAKKAAVARKGKAREKAHNPFLDSDLDSSDEDERASGQRGTKNQAAVSRKRPRRGGGVGDTLEGNVREQEQEFTASGAQALLSRSDGPVISVFDQITTPTWAEKAEEYQAARAKAKRKELKKRRRKFPRPGEPLRPLSAYFQFCSQLRARHSDEWRDEGLNLTTISRLCGARWKTLPAQEKDEMKKAAVEAMKAYKIAKADWDQEHPEDTDDLSDSEEPPKPPTEAYSYTPRQRARRGASDEEADYKRRKEIDPDSLLVNSRAAMADIAIADFRRGRPSDHTFDAIRRHQQVRQAERERRLKALKREARHRQAEWRKLNGQPADAGDESQDDAEEEPPSGTAKIKERASMPADPNGTGTSRGGRYEETEEVVGSDDPDDNSLRRFQSGAGFNSDEDSDAGPSIAQTYKPNSSALQMRMQDGVMVINQATLHRDRNQAEEEGGSVVEVNEKDVFYNSKTKSKYTRGDRWTPQETMAFYEAHSQWGTDFGIIARLFPRRTRAQIRQKYNRELKLNPDLIDSAFEQRLPVNLETYGYAVGVDLSGPPPEIKSRAFDGSDDEMVEADVDVTDNEGDVEYNADGELVKKTKKIRKLVKRSNTRTPSVKPTVRRPSVSSVQADSVSRASQASEDEDEDMPDVSELLQRSRRASSAHSAAARSVRSASVVSTATAASTRTGTSGRTQKRRELEKDRKGKEEEMRRERERGRRAGALSKPADEELVADRDDDRNPIEEEEVVEEDEDEDEDV